jgi:hypothetical protein
MLFWNIPLNTSSPVTIDFADALLAKPIDKELPHTYR